MGTRKDVGLRVVCQASFCEVPRHLDSGLLRTGTGDYVGIMENEMETTIS